MDLTRTTRRKTGWWLLAFAVALASGAAGLSVWTQQRAKADPGRHLYVFGPEAETVLASDVTEAEAAQARVALADMPYHGAFAAGPGGREGLWSGAHSLPVARDHALAACGTGCRIVAERLPLHRQEVPGDTALSHAIAQRVAHRWPYNGSEWLARGGAGAWGVGKDTGRFADTAARRKALDECEARRAAETPPPGAVSPPCRAMRLVDLEDMRPPRALYPAPYTVAPVQLMPVTQTVLQRRPDAPERHALRQPEHLHGARASGGARGASGVIDRAGWPEAGMALALRMCELDRRLDDAPCRPSFLRSPAGDLPAGALAVSEAAFAAFRDWQTTDGAGAFAIGPLGAWGSAHGFDDPAAAMQHAADWCHHATGRGRDYHMLKRALQEPGIPCRIVALRER